MIYPEAPLGDVVDDYHGIKVADPYRWLEDAASPATLAWVVAQNALTARLLATPERSALVARLTALYDYPRLGAPIKRGTRYFYTLNEGLQNQPVLYVQDGLVERINENESDEHRRSANVSRPFLRNGRCTKRPNIPLEGSRRVILDPNTLSPDGTVALTAFAPSHDGRLLGYALSRHGSDRQELYVRDVATGRDHADRVFWAKFTSITWTRDASGFYYTRFPQPGTVSPEDENYFAKVFFHRLGDAQEQDRLIYERPDDREIVMSSEISSDGRWVVITAFKGSSEDSESYVIDREARDQRPRAVFTGFDASYIFAGATAGRLFFRTTRSAARGRIVSVDVSSGLPDADSRGQVPFVEVLAEQPETLTTALVVGERLVTVSLRNASDAVRVYNLRGAPLHELALPALGSLSGVTGEADDAELFIRFSSFTFPPTVFRTNVTRKAPLERFGEAGVTSIDPLQFDVTQVWYPSKDGTRVSMFLVHRVGLVRDGNRPVLLTAYGGFNINLTPQFDPANFIWLERDGIVAVPNLRGGGEYGEQWHEAGMFERKQNVFDDFIAAAEWLVANGYTRPERLAIEGGSNGGLLVGAVMLQRPELFGAVVCRVPVADMLRYHRFTVGRFWISEYGCADNPEQFQYLYAYSPLHNVRDGTRYPATLIMTADTDDRVDPGMAKKFAARLQAADTVGGPILIRVEMKAGHGAGKPVAKMVEEDADIFAFLTRFLGRNAELRSQSA